MSKDYQFQIGPEETIEGQPMFVLLGTLKRKDIPKEMAADVKSIAGQARMVIGKKNGFLYVWEAAVKWEPKEEQPYPLGQSTGVFFTEVKFNSDIKDEQFQFRPPADVKVEVLAPIKDETRKETDDGAK